MPRHVKALLLAAGLGTRLRPLTDHLPKCLTTIAGRPLLDWWIDRLADAGVVEAAINSHAHPRKLRAYVRAVNRSGRLRLTEWHEPQLLGSAGTLAAHPDFADDADEVLIVCADQFGDVDLSALLAYHCGHGDPATLLLYHSPRPHTCGIVELDPDNRVVSFVEKPAVPRSDLANGGIYVVSAAAYREMAAVGGRDLGFDVFPRWVGRMRGWTWSGYHVDIGNPEALARARSDAPRVLGESIACSRPAVFFDRDGTLIESVHYLARPEQVRLLPGAAAAIRRLRGAGYACVVVTNQSAIGRGLLSEEGLALVHAELVRQLAEEDADLDAIYHCPVVPASDDRAAVEHPDRKPGPGMLLRAAADLELDLGESWMVGDMLSDVLAGHRAGCRGNVLVRTGLPTCEAGIVAGVRYQTADDLTAAADLILPTARRQATNHCPALALAGAAG